MDKSSWRCNPDKLLEEYEKGQKDVFNGFYSSTKLLLSRIFSKIKNTGCIEEIEKKFLIDYMKSGMVNDIEFLNYEYLRKQNPSINLPKINT